ncbi:hypothetical protein Tco_0103491 [Tanacetum coccineum]
MKEEFPSWFGKQIRQHHKDNDPGVNESSELFALACGPSQTPISVNSYVVNGVRFVVHSRDERRTTQNSGICSPGPDEEMYYGQLEQILEFSYLSFKTVLFRANGEAFKNDQYIPATQIKQCFYLEDMARRPLGWNVVEHVSHKKFSNEGVIAVKDDPDVIHVDNSSDLALSTSLNDLEIAALHIDGQSIDVDAPPDIIDVVDEDDDTIDEEDPIPHDLADSDDEDLVNLDIDDDVNIVYSSEEEGLSLVVTMSADVARGHGGDGGGDDRPPPYQVPTGCGGCLGNRGKGTRKPNLGGRKTRAGTYRQEHREPGLKAITDKSGPIPIRFEVDDRETLMPLGDHAAHWANYLGELVRELPLLYPSWRQMSPERKAGVVAKIGFGLRPHMESGPLAQILCGHSAAPAKISMARKVLSNNDIGFLEENGIYAGGLRRGVPRPFSEGKLDAHKESSDEMLRLQGLGSNTPTGVPYTEDEIMAIVRGGKQRGHIPGVGRVLPGQGTVIPPPSQSTHSADIARLKKREKRLTKQVNMFMRLFRSDDKFSQMLNQLESQPEYGGGSGSGGCGDDEPGDDEDGGEDEEDEDDS